MNTRHSLIALCALPLLAACGGQEDAPATETPAPPPVAAPAAPAASEAPAAAPATAGVDAPDFYAKRCASCHGKEGEGLVGNPALTNLSVNDVKLKLEAYRAGQTLGPRTAVMAPMAKALSDEQVEALAIFLGK